MQVRVSVRVRVRVRVRARLRFGCGLARTARVEAIEDVMQPLFADLGAGAGATEQSRLPVRQQGQPHALPAIGRGGGERVEHDLRNQSIC